MDTDSSLDNLKNQTDIQIYVEKESSDIRNLDLNWTFVNFEENMLMIQVLFKNPELISTGLVFDQINFKVFKWDIFKSTNGY